MAKLDNQADNVAHLQETINNTTENLLDTVDHLDAHEGSMTAEKKQILEEKNDRRRASIKSCSKEISEELQ